MIEESKYYFIRSSLPQNPQLAANARRLHERSHECDSCELLRWKCMVSHEYVTHETQIVKTHLHGAMLRAIDRTIDRKRPDRTV